jgi:hypothetical protein
MDLQDITNVASILGSLALVVSVIILIRELRAGNKLIKASNTQALVQLSSPFQMGLIQDRQMAQLCARGSRSFDDLDDIDQYRYRSLVTWWLVFHENVYYQWKQGLLDDHTYKPWAKDLRVFLRDQNLGRLWAKMEDMFQDEFANHVSGLISWFAEPPDQDNALSQATSSVRNGVTSAGESAVTAP